MSGEDEVQCQLGPGKYFVGDICYALDETIYHDIWGKKHNFVDGSFEVNNAVFVVAGTAYGDGGYAGSDGIDYSVDAGVIGVVPISLWKKGEAPTGGRIVTAKTGVSFSAFEGVFTITVDNEVIKIDTRDEEGGLG